MRPALRGRSTVNNPLSGLAQREPASSFVLGLSKNKLERIGKNLVSLWVNLEDQKGRSRLCVQQHGLENSKQNSRISNSKSFDQELIVGKGDWKFDWPFFAQLVRWALNLRSIPSPNQVA